MDGTFLLLISGAMYSHTHFGFPKQMDCQEGLRCFQRNGGEEVPGCSCGAEDDSRTDYCIEIEYPTVRESDEFPLGLCQGDCDDNVRLSLRSYILGGDAAHLRYGLSTVRLSRGTGLFSTK